MRRAVLLGTAFWSLFDLELPASIIATLIALSLRARRSIIAAVAFSSLSLFLQLLLSPIIDRHYALRVYLFVVAIGGSVYTIEPEELMCVLLRLRIPRRLVLVAYLSQSYVWRIANASIDAKLVAMWKYRGFLQRLRAMLLGTLYFVLEESMALAELIEAYLKNPITPKKSYLKEFIAFLLIAFLPSFLSCL